MRKAKYDRRQVICRNASLIGYSTNVARPGSWVSYSSESDPDRPRLGRVIGRIARTDADGENCAGWLAVMRLSMEGTAAFVDWVNPDSVRYCYDNPPRELFTWITGEDWVKTADDIARMVAMAQHGTTSGEFIATRDDPEKPYNARPAYRNQWILE